MYRCDFPAVVLATAALACCLGAQAQTHRDFPRQALRGELKVLQAPDVLLNGQTARLAPGARIRAENNLLVLSASLAGQISTVHYTIDNFGMLKDVWLLNAAELANKTWPRTAEEAARWVFDPASQTWTRP